MQQYGNNGRPYDQNRDSLRSSGSSQRTMPPNDGASDTSRYGFNGEPLSRPPARTANGTVRRTRTDNSIEFPTQPRPVRDTGSAARRPAGQRSTAQRPRSSGGQNRRPAQRPANRNGRPAQNSRSAARQQQQGQGYNKNQKLRPAPQRDAQRREGHKKRRLTRAAIRRRRMLRRLATFGLLLCVIGIGMYLTVTMLFRISAIQVQTADGTQVTEIAGYSADSILQTLGVQVEENIFSFDSGAKAAELERQYPLLESIRVVRDYPNTVVVQVTEATPTYAVQAGSSWLTLSDKFKILSADPAQPDGLCTLYGGEATTAAPGEQLSFAAPEADSTADTSAASDSSAFGVVDEADAKMSALATLQAKLDELGISHDDGQITLTREISADGGSVARINSRASTVSVMKEIGECLVNIHGQHDNQILMSPEQHIGILDSYGGLEEQRDDYHESFKQLQEVSRKLKKMSLERKEMLEREESLKIKVEEIGSLNIEEGEDEELEAEYQIAGRSEDIRNGLGEAHEYLAGVEDSDVPGALELITNACDDLSAIADTMEPVKKLYDRLENVRVELDDIISEISSERDNVDIDAERFGYLTDRITELNRIKKKYGPELSDVLECYNKASRELSALGYSSDEIERTAEEREHLLAQVSEKAKKLSAARSQAAERFSKQVEEELNFLDMPGVKIGVAMEKGKLTAAGMDTVEFMISTNKGEGMKPMSKIASGGELSRIMLALKNVIAEKDDIHTLIFDEIDTGVSGRAAQKIGIKLKSVSKNQQVLCVTHLSQLAVMADNHLLIEKQTRGNPD